MNFLALVVIADFDEYFYNVIKGDPLCAIVTGDGSYENFLIIQCTTSVQARDAIDYHFKPINKLKPQPCEVNFVDDSKIESAIMRAS